MARGVASLDWSLVQAFLAVVEHGSLSAAARALGTTQPTVGRQVHTMQEQLGAELFQRRDKGLALTPIGEGLLASARAMRNAAHEMELRAASHGERLEGTVRVTSSVAVATHHLPAMVAQIRREEPRICIELDVSDDSSRLHFREADIAIRMYRPKQLELVTQHLGDLRLGIFAARTYAERRGLPGSAADLLDHDVVGMDRGTLILDGLRRAGLPVGRDWFRVRCDDQAVLWQLVRAGCGIGFAQAAIGRQDPELVEIPLDLDLPTLPIWLTAHEAIVRTPRVRHVWNRLADGLRKLVSQEQRYPAPRRG